MVVRHAYLLWRKHGCFCNSPEGALAVPALQVYVVVRITVSYMRR